MPGCVGTEPAPGKTIGTPSLERARDTPAAVLRTIAARSLAEIEDALVKDRLNALAWFAAAGLLEIKLALRITAQGA
ncbi:hypothetical protein [uncultured Thiodictyon sp.]|uniref:hypothetical protein n=1 Tax=uncultured Thiodictyon sp. TaxID=1846217 RepID=UPI0025EE4CC9|nr:hypothetical protein [uncultured Thiodictyon sp.]